MSEPENSSQLTMPGIVDEQSAAKTPELTPVNTQVLENLIQQRVDQLAAGKIILVVDDDNAAASVMSKLLSRRNFATFSAKDIKEAQAIIAGMNPDQHVFAIISDWKLPDGVGTSFESMIKKDPKLAGTHLLIATGAGMDEVSGPNVIQKPIDMDTQIVPKLREYHIRDELTLVGQQVPRDLHAMIANNGVTETRKHELDSEFSAFHNVTLPAAEQKPAELDSQEREKTERRQYRIERRNHLVRVKSLDMRIAQHDLMGDIVKDAQGGSALVISDEQNVRDLRSQVENRHAAVRLRGELTKENGEWQALTHDDGKWSAREQRRLAAIEAAKKERGV